MLTDASHTPGGKREGTWEGAASALAEELSFAGQGNSRCGAGGGSGGQAAGPRGLWQGPTLRAQPASRPSAPPRPLCGRVPSRPARRKRPWSFKLLFRGARFFTALCGTERTGTIFPIPGSFLFFLSDKTGHPSVPPAYSYTHRYNKISLNIKEKNTKIHGINVHFKPRLKYPHDDNNDNNYTDNNHNN